MIGYSVEPLLFWDLEANDETTSATRQQIHKKQIQESLLSNGFSNKHVPIETIEQQQRNDVFCAVRDQML
jgi:hypothetical protein